MSKEAKEPRIQVHGDALAESPLSATFKGTFDGDPVIIKMVRAIGEDLREHWSWFTKTVVPAASGTPNIVQYLASKGPADEDSPFVLITELCDESIESKMPLALCPESISLVEDVVFALETMKNAGVYHGNLTYENILIKDGEVKVSDFGISKLQQRQVTQLSIFCAPEVLASQKFSFAADVYSLGILMIEAFTNNQAYKGSYGEQVKAILQGTKPFIDPSAPKGIYDLIQRCISFDPDNRPSLQEVREMLALMRRLLYPTKHFDTKFESKILNESEVVVETSKAVSLMAASQPTSANNQRTKALRICVFILFYSFVMFIILRIL
ncbi:hypothetical protein RCL1_008566 [Eukaryota sp. TZLM3-RCL]